MNRLGIFCFYENDGVVYQYIKYLLDDLIKNVDHLYIVCNGELTDEGFLDFKKYTDNIIVRENIGFDSWAFKEVLQNNIGFSNLKNYDELLLINNSFYGPVYPFSELFSKMEKKSVDFWGLLNHGGDKSLNIKYHIQSYFLVVRKNMLHSDFFIKFWEELLFAENFTSAIMNFENIFTRFFLDCGFTHDVFFDTTNKAFLNENTLNDKYYDYSINKAAFLLENGFPIIKKKVFSNTHTFNNSGNEIFTSLYNIKNSNNENGKIYFDSDLIVEHMIKKDNIKKIKENLSLNYVLPVHETNYLENEINNNQSVAIFINILDDFNINVVRSFFNNIPFFVNVYITTNNKNLYQSLLDLNLEFENVKFLLIENVLDKNVLDKNVLDKNVLNENSFLYVLKKLKPFILKHDVLCFLSDYKSFIYNDVLKEDIFRQAVLDNLIISKKYILNVLNIFDKNKKIGLLVPYNNLYFDKNYNFWGEHYEKTATFLKSLNVQSKLIDENISPLTYNFNFWCKKEALLDLFELDLFENNENNENNENLNFVVERSLSFIAQKNGFLTASVENVQYIQNMLVFNNKKNIVEENKGLLDYIKNYDELYVYGCGEYSVMLSRLLYEIDANVVGYIVTKKNNEKNKFKNKPIFLVEDVFSNNIINDKTGIILAVGLFNSKPVKAELNKLGYDNYFSLF